MRKYIATAIIGLMVWSGAASAQTTITQPDISLRDIFDTLVAKVKKTSDQAFFENEVLQARAKKELDPNAHNSYKYTYGPELSGKGSTYRVDMDKKGAQMTSFWANDFSNLQTGGCISFKEAQTKLLEHGWVPAPAPDMTMPGEVHVSELYKRSGVTLTISLFQYLLPFPERWNSAEFNESMRNAAIKAANEQQNIKPETDAYESRCITSLDIEILQ